MSNEEWRPVPGWPYEVSDGGRVRRKSPGTSTTLGRIVRPHGPYENSPYLSVRISRGSRRRVRTFAVHQLVARAFLGPLPNGHHVNHINSDKTDNRAENLEYVTAQRNCAHAVANGRGRTAWAKLTPAAVRELRRGEWDAGRSRREAERYGVSVSAIQKARSGATWESVR